MPWLMVPAKICSLPHIFEFITKNLPEEFLPLQSRIKLSVEEIFANISNYAYADSKDSANEPTAEFSCKVVDLDGERCFYIQICDEGKPFNPFSEAPTPDLSLDVEDRPIGGLGVFLTKSSVKSCNYKYTEHKNIIELYFAL